MHIIRFNKQVFKGPSKWEELTAESLIGLAICTGAISHYTRAFLVMALFKIPDKLFTRLKECQVIQLEPLINWVFEHNTLKNWLLKSIKVRKTTLYGPKNRLADLTIEEFTYAEGAYERWLTCEKDEFLNTLFAVLYRPKGFFALKKEDFNPDRLDKYEKRAKAAPRYLKKAVLINYAGCRNFIIECHPYIWKKGPPDEEKPACPAKPTNWTQLVLNLSGDKFGSYQETRKVALWLVLADFNKKAKDNEELEARLRS